MTPASQILRGTSLQLVGRAVSLVLSLVTLTLTIRYLGVSEFGLLVTVVAFAGLFESFVDLGVGTVIVRRVSGGAGSLERLVGLNLGMSLVYAVPLWLLAAAAGFVVYADRPQVQLGIAIVGVGLVFRAVSTCFVPIYETAVRFGALTLSDVTSRVAALALTILAIRRDAGVVALMTIQVVPPLIALVFMFVVAQRRGRFRPLFASREALDLLRESLPLAGLYIVAIVYYRVDGVLLSVLSSPAQVGAYGLAYRFAGNAAIVGTIFVNSAFSTMARSWAQGRGTYNAFVSRCLSFMLICAAPVAIVGIALGPDLVRLIAADSYTPSAGRAMQLLFVAIAIGYLNAVMSQALIAAHEQRYLVAASPLALAFNVAANLVLVPSYGAEGAGLALVATELLSAIAAATWLHRATGYRLPLGFVVRLVPSVALSAAAMWATPGAPVLVRVLALGFVYPVGLLMTGAVRVSDVRRLITRSPRLGAGGRHERVLS